jgi:HlyD family secretion protein
MAGELNLFRSRAQALEGQRAQLRERIAQISQEIEGLSAQLHAKEKEISFIEQELEGVSDLYNKKLVTVVRYNQLQRDQARLGGERDIEGRLSEVKEKVIAAGDQFDRVNIRAPQSGVVHQLAVHTVGGVIAQGETVMLIVPRNDVLVLEGKVEPQDIDQIEVGAPVHVRVMAGNQRTTPDLLGVLDRKAADLTQDQKNNHSYYVVRVALAKDELKKLGTLKLMPGMPAEAFIVTGERTPLQYLLKPLMDQIAHAFRER